MFSNQACYNEKLAKVISLSNNYQRHYDNMNNIKPAVDFSNHKRMKKVLQLSTEKSRYNQNVRKHKLNELHKENESIIRRLRDTNSHVGRQIKPTASISPRTSQQRTLDHNMSNKSLLSNISEKTVGSNWRRRTIRQKEIDQQNKKIAERLMHPKMSKDVSLKKFNKFYQQEQNHSRIRSRFSDRSQTIMQSLALGGLKMQRKNFQFLPQLSYKRLDKSINKNLTSRSRQPAKKTILLDNPEHK